MLVSARGCNAICFCTRWAAGNLAARHRVDASFVQRATLQQVSSLPQAQTLCHTLDTRSSKLGCSVPSRPRAARTKRSHGAVADSSVAVGAAAVAEAPRVNLVPKPVTSVLHDLTRFHGLPSLGKHLFAFSHVPACCCFIHVSPV